MRKIFSKILITILCVCLSVSCLTACSVSAEGVTLSRQEVTINVGEDTVITATVMPENATNKNVTWSTSDQTVATVKNGRITGVKAGSAVITAKTVNGGYTASCAVTVEDPSASVVAVESVSLNKTTATLDIDDTETLTATVLPKNATDKSVTWESSNADVATVSNGVVTAISAGTAIITVKTTDGEFTATCQITVNAPAPEIVSVESVSLDKTNVALEVGDVDTLTATVLPTNATNKDVVWQSSDTAIVTVADGVVAAVGVGSATVTVITFDGEFTATCVVTVSAKSENPSDPVAVTSVSLNKTSATVERGENETLIATVLPANATDKSVTWQSSDTEVATVVNGVVTAVGVGSATITAKTIDGEFTATCQITVKISVQSVSLNQKTLALKMGGTETLTATVLPVTATNKSVTWESSNTAVATVVDGQITAVSVGTSTITVKTVDGELTATCTVTVRIAVESVSLNKSTTTLEIGGTETLTATVLPVNATDKSVTWESSDTSIVGVVNGVITGVFSGTATITVKTVDGELTATCEVVVNQAQVSADTYIVRYQMWSIVRGSKVQVVKETGENFVVSKYADGSSTLGSILAEGTFKAVNTDEYAFYGWMVNSKRIDSSEPSYVYNPNMTIDQLLEVLEAGSDNDKKLANEIRTTKVITVVAKSRALWTGFY